MRESHLYAEKSFSRDMECGKHNFLSFPTDFCHFTLPAIDPENQNFENMKIIPADIIILHMCSLNGNHMMYGSWDIKCGRHNVLSFWTDFCPFIPPAIDPECQSFENMKIYISHMVAINDNHMMYGS